MFPYEFAEIHHIKIISFPNQLECAKARLGSQSVTKKLTIKSDVQKIINKA